MRTFLLVVACLVALAVVSVLGILIFSRNARLKSRLRAVIILGPALTFLGLVLRLAQGSPHKVFFLWVVAPVVALASALAFSAIRFCPHCGATLFNGNPFKIIPSCSHCGTKFGLKP